MRHNTIEPQDQFHDDELEEVPTSDPEEEDLETWYNRSVCVGFFHRNWSYLGLHSVTNLEKAQEQVVVMAQRNSLPPGRPR